MFKQILIKATESLSKEELVNNLSEDDLKIIYIFIKVSKILVVTIWAFSIIFSHFIGLTLNPQSLLIDWSIDHKYLIIFMFIFSLFIPASFLLLLSSSLDSIANFLYKDLSLKILSPRKIWILSYFVVFLVPLLLGFIYSVSGV
jgi:hypothetical protein